MVLFFLSMSIRGWADEDLKTVTAPEGCPPSDAVILFDGGSTDALLSTHGKSCQWPVVDGAMVVHDGFVVSKLHFRDAQIHVEFAMPDDCQGECRIGNSGIYLHGLFEMQITNREVDDSPPELTIGAVYNIAPPLVNATRRPGQWQSYDILYTAPRHNEAGVVEKPGTITAFLNGVLVQHNCPVTKSVSVYNPLVHRTTPYTDKILESIRQTDAGPLFLQDHYSPVRFRNIWIRPLDECAKIFNGKMPE